jgi:hypothetical protein
MQVATNYEQWGTYESFHFHSKHTKKHSRTFINEEVVYSAAAGLALDRILGNDKWKKEQVSPDYEYELIGDRLLQLRAARQSGDLGMMVFILRTSLSRNLGGIGKSKVPISFHIECVFICIKSCTESLISAPKN